MVMYQAFALVLQNQRKAQDKYKYLLQNHLVSKLHLLVSHETLLDFGKILPHLFKNAILQGIVDSWTNMI